VCERFIDQQGLPRIFPIYMCKNKVKGPAGEHDVDTQVGGGARAARLRLRLWAWHGAAQRRGDWLAPSAGVPARTCRRPLFVPQDLGP
jgi:hypothetical protein